MRQITPLWRKMQQNKILRSVARYASEQAPELFSMSNLESEADFQEKLSFNLPDFEGLAGKYDVVIHIGIPKTGSSAIQSFLLQNSSQLNKLGFYYPYHKCDKNNISGGHSKLSNYLINNNVVAAKSVFDDYLSQAREKRLTLLLSAESLYYKPDQLKEVIQEKKCKIVAFFRDPVAAIFSNYNQIVKRHFATATFEQFCRNIVASNNDIQLTGKIFDQWSEDYSQQNLTVLGYDPALFEQIRIEQLFLKVLGINEVFFDDFQYVEKKINQSYTGLALELKRLLNFVLDEEQGHYNGRIDFFLQNHSDQFNETSYAFLQGQISDELYCTLNDKFKDSNQYLVNEILTNINPGFLKAMPRKLVKADRKQYDDSQLKNLLEKLFKEEPDLKKYIVDRTAHTLSSSGGRSYYVLRLGELLGINIHPYAVTVPMFTKAQINVFLSKKSQPADLLREIAATMERQGDDRSALLITERALELRPKAPGIILLRDRIKSKV